MTRPTSLDNIIPVRDNYEGSTTSTIGTGAVTLTVTPDPELDSGVIELQYPTNPSKVEMMRFTANSGGVLTIPADGRGLGGTTEQSHTSTGVTVLMPYSENIHQSIDDALNLRVTTTDPVLNGSITGSAIIDDDNLAGASGTTVASSESVKAYIDDKVIAAGSGDVVGQVSSTDNAVVRFDGTTGKVIQGSDVTIDDNGSITIPAGQKFGNIDNYATASQAEAEAGTATDKFMTPERVKQYFQANFVKADITVDAAGKGDYDTIDDAVTNASEGDLIFIKSGTYTLSGNLTIPNGCVLVGENKHNTIVDSNIDRNITIAQSTIKYAGTVALTQSDATITGTGTAFASGDVGSKIAIFNSATPTNDFDLFVSTIDSFTSTTSLELTDVYSGETLSGYNYVLADFISNVGLVGLQFTDKIKVAYTNSYNCYINNCIFNKSASSVEAIIIQNANGININLTIDNCEFNDGDIIVKNAGGIDYSTSILNSIISNMDGIFTVSGGYSVAHKIYDSYIMGCQNVNLEIQGSIKGSKILHCERVSLDDYAECIGNHISLVGQSTDGIVCSGDYNRVLNNYIYNADKGIDVGGDYHVISNNVVDSCNTGIDIADGNNIVSSNIVRSCDADGIYVNGNENIISNNQLSANGAYGININAGTENIIIGNMMFNNTSGGLNNGGTSTNDTANITT